MPFKSKAQRRWMYATHPEMAKRWEEETTKKSLPEKVSSVLWDGFSDELEKIALHADDRLKERTPELDSKVLEDIRSRIKGMKLPKGKYFVTLKDKSGKKAGYAAIKTVDTKKGPMPVLATVLGKDMGPRGTPLSIKD